MFTGFEFRDISKRVLSPFFMVIVLLSATSAYGKENSACLTINIEGLTNNKGVVRIALFNSKKTFSDHRYGINGAVKYGTLKIEAKKTSWIVKDLPCGTYAVRTFHDEDESGKFKVNRFGIPKYEYGFSNDARALFGPPSYDKAKFEFSSDKTIKITMHR